MILGEAGSKVKLRVLRSAVKPQTIEVERGLHKVPHAAAKVEEGKIGIITVYSLEDGEYKDVRSQLETLIKQGVEKVVLDLRGVSAGSITEAVDVANLFFKDGDLAQIIGRENKVLKKFTADSAKFLFSGDLVVLIDIGSAGASEVIASAVLDRKRGDVVGEKSFGAGTEQQLFTLRGGDGLLLTTSKWASASGKAFLGDTRDTTGVRPSVEVKRADSSDTLDPEELTDETENEPTETPVEKPKQPAPEDVQLKKALEILSGTDKAMQKSA